MKISKLLVNEILAAAKVVLEFSRSELTGNKLDEVDTLLVRGGIKGKPDFTNIKITIDKKDLAKAKKILGKTYKYKVK